MSRKPSAYFCMKQLRDFFQIFSQHLRKFCKIVNNKKCLDTGFSFRMNNTPEKSEEHIQQKIAVVFTFINRIILLLEVSNEQCK